MTILKLTRLPTVHCWLLSLMNNYLVVAGLIAGGISLALTICRVWKQVFVDPYGDREFRSALRKIEKEKRRMRPR